MHSYSSLVIRCKNRCSPPHYF